MLRPPIAPLRVQSILLISIALGVPAVEAQPAFQTIHVFSAAGDGSSPRAGLAMASSGVAYGTTLYGGASNNGAVYQLTPVTGTTNWTESVIYSFGPSPDGANPAGTLIVGTGGELYGTTIAGGSSNAGTVFELTPPAGTGGSWTETVLYNFAGAPDGAAPHAGLILGAGGVLYGTTAGGGNINASCPSGCGTVFSLTPPSVSGGLWTETPLHRFTGTDGANPFASLTETTAGLYGTTVNGGSGFGEVFSLPASGTFEVLYRFAGGDDGANPYAALTVSTKGVFYGTARNGGAAGLGTAFSITKKGILTVLHTFTGVSDGANPAAGLFLDGTLLYGVASLGGAKGDGTLFRLQETSPTTSFKVLHTFSGAKQSANPLSTLVMAPSAALLGTTEPAQVLLEARPDTASGGSGYEWCTKNPPSCGN